MISIAFNLGFYFLLSLSLIGMDSPIITTIRNEFDNEKPLYLLISALKTVIISESLFRVYLPLIFPTYISLTIFLLSHLISNVQSMDFVLSKSLHDFIFYYLTSNMTPTCGLAFHLVNEILIFVFHLHLYHRSHLIEKTEEPGTDEETEEDETETEEESEETEESGEETKETGKEGESTESQKEEKKNDDDEILLPLSDSE